MSYLLRRLHTDVFKKFTCCAVLVGLVLLTNSSVRAQSDVNEMNLVNSRAEGIARRRKGILSEDGG